MNEDIRKMIDEVKNFKQFVNEDFDLIGQFKGEHDGNPMPKNKFLNSLGLDEEGIKTLQIWVNLIFSDRNWIEQTYPNGTNDSILISDISKKVRDLPSFVMKYESVNPIKVVNALKKLMY